MSNPHEAVHLDGTEINWLHPPKVTRLVRWSKKTWTGKRVSGSFRHICHLNRLNNLSLRRFGRELEIIQPAWNIGVKASAGTHDMDSVVDLYVPGIDWWEQQRFFRANGLGCWYRHPPSFGNHIHGFTLPPVEGVVRSDDFAMAGFRVGVFVPQQLADYYAHAYGLAGSGHTPGADPSWFPRRIEDTIFDLDQYVARRAAKVLAARKH